MSKEFTEDFEEAWEIFDAPVQCGDCYVFYDPAVSGKCPLCGGDEWVGSR
ncbi:MAG: hypothetical protein PF518_04870 [Spirochaetaceae bacterium]|jgi:hypothetical protein|nr:hypothetical protein [Spirochaetaceae bacterium]